MCYYIVCVNIWTRTFIHIKNRLKMVAFLESSSLPSLSVVKVHATEGFFFIV